MKTNFILTLLALFLFSVGMTVSMYFRIFNIFYLNSKLPMITYSLTSCMLIISVYLIINTWKKITKI
jgi:hypothetical protein